MYLDAAALSQQEGWSNNVAQKQFAAWKLNRLKLAKIKEHLESCKESNQDVTMAPQASLTGRYGAGLLSLAQKKDLHTHITLCALSNRMLTIAEVKLCILKVVLWNEGVLTKKQLKEQDADIDLDSYSPFFRLYMFFAVSALPISPNKSNLMG